MANKANKAKGRIVKAVNKTLSGPRPQGPAPRKRVTLYTPEAAKAAGKRYRAAVQEGIAAGRQRREVKLESLQHAAAKRLASNQESRN